MQHLHDPSALGALLSSRILNRDSSGLVMDRLDHDALESLVLWYTDDEHGDHGVRLVESAPLLDAWLEGVLPPIPADEPGHGCTLGAVAFTAGLVFGVEARASMDAEGLEDEPLDLGASLEVHAASFRLPEQWGPEDRKKVTIGLLELHKQLEELESRTPALMYALFLLAIKHPDESPLAATRLGWCRFLFLAGAVAAGISVWPTIQPGPPAHERSGIAGLLGGRSFPIAPDSSDLA